MKEELLKLWENLDSGSNKLGVNINSTKNITNGNVDNTVIIGQEKMEQVDEFIYLGQINKIYIEN